MGANIKKAIILRGSPHSGKSYYAASRNDAFVISSDHQFLMPDDKLLYSYKSEGASHKNCRIEFLGACQASIQTILVDDFNIFQRDLRFYKKITEYYGYELEIIRFRANPRQAAKRNWRGFDFKKCHSMEAFLRKQPLWENETVFERLEYKSNKTKAKNAAKKLAPVKIRPNGILQKLSRRH